MNFITVEENEINLKKAILSGDDLAEMIAIKAILFRFLDKSKVSYQLSLGMWKHRGKESDVYAKVEAMNELKSAIEDMEWKLNEYNKVQQEKNDKK